MSVALRAFNETRAVTWKGMYEVHAMKISMHLDTPSPAHTDGELLPEWIQDFEYDFTEG
jgi:hypothetical protein